MLTNTGKMPVPPETRELIARTIGEASILLGVSTRTLAAWCTEPGFPGTPGGPGKQDGDFPIAAIRDWHLATHARATNGKDDDEETLRTRRLKQQIEVDHAQVDLEKELQTIGDTLAWEQFCRRVVAAAKAQLEELPDRVNARLPGKLPAALRATIRKVIAESVFKTLNTFAELVAGDCDETEDLPDDGGDA